MEVSNLILRAQTSLRMPTNKQVCGPLAGRRACWFSAKQTREGLSLSDTAKTPR